MRSVRMSTQKGDVMCKTRVSEQYIRTQTMSKTAVDVVFLMHRRNERTRAQNWAMHGFALCRLVSAKDALRTLGQQRGDSADTIAAAVAAAPDSMGLYVDVICARSLTGALLTEVEKSTCSFGLDFVQLSALPHVINFYRKRGFHHSPVCGKENTQTRALAERQKGKRFVAAESIFCPAPSSGKLQVKDGEMYDFMRHLVREGYSVTCAAESQRARRQTESSDASSHGTRDITRQEFWHKDCDEDGFTMFKCVACHLQKNPSQCRSGICTGRATTAGMKEASPPTPSHSAKREKRQHRTTRKNGRAKQTGKRPPPTSNVRAKTRRARTARRG